MVAIGKTFAVNPSAPDDRERVEVDVVCNNGAHWLKLKATRVETLHLQWRGRTKGQKDVITQAARGMCLCISVLYIRLALI